MLKTLGRPDELFGGHGVPPYSGNHQRRDAFRKGHDSAKAYGHEAL